MHLPELKLQPKRENEVRILTIYFAKWCGTCKKVVPNLTSLAEKAGFLIQLIDVDDPSNRKMCSHVRWVPYIEYNGSEISIQEFLQLIALAKEE